MVYGINKKETMWKDIFVFILGLFSLIKVRLLGTFAVGEIIVFASYLFIANSMIFRKYRDIKRLMWLSAMWLCGVIIADWYNHTNMEDSLKGMFNVIFIIGLIPIVYWAVYDKPQRVIWFWIGNGISSLLGFYFQRITSYSDYDASVWLVYAYYPLVIAISGWLYYKGRSLWACLLIESFALWSLWNMSRNIFLCMSLAVAFILLIGKVNSANVEQKYKIFRRKLPVTIITFCITALFVSWTYEYLASNRVLGERAYHKYLVQKNSELGLASGRADFFESAELIAKNPIIGYGSYAKGQATLEIPESLPYAAKIKIGNSEQLQGHSYVLGAWVYSGILGAIFWFAMIVYIFRLGVRGIFSEPRLIGLYSMLMFLMLWNILFSPFSDRLNFIFFITTAIILLRPNYGLREINH